MPKLRKTEPLLTLEPGLYPHTVSCDGTERDSPRTNFPRLRADNGSKENVYCGQQLSRQNQKPHGKNKIPHDKTKNLMAKPKTSRQNQSYFAFAVKYLVFPWGCFCREVFGFAVWYFVFAVRFLVLPWCFCREVFDFAVTVVGHHWPKD